MVELDTKKLNGYTNGMKTAISLPEVVFRQAERFARRFKKSRSQLYVEAITEYLERHAPDTITEAMNSVCDRLEDTDSSFSSAAATKVLSQEQW
jgi:metal-responsive CopG/Arc/MetJ family transcriptional regulator